MTMRNRRFGLWLWLLIGGGVTAGCAPGQPQVTPPVLRADFSVELVTREPAPRPGECWHGALQPAVFETVTEQVVVRPEQRSQSGEILAPAVIQTEMRQREIRPRQPIWFRIPCPQDGAGDPGFVASLQRALKARGLYGGPITGQMDSQTDDAVLRYQAASGLDNAVLSLRAAQALGLVAVR